MLVLQTEEKTAIAILLLVTVVCLLGTFLLDGMGKDSFSQEYVPGMQDGTLVSLKGSIGSMHIATGGSMMLEISGVSVFVPVSAGQTPDIREGSGVRIIGTIQQWKGKEEILVDDAADIELIS